MQTVRSNLTRMKTSIEKKLPADQDIFGYPGISKELIVACVDEAHALSYKLADLEPQFEITVLKRKISKFIDDCKDYLNSGIDGWSKEKKFDRFISSLTKIREEIRLTYLIVIDRGLRTETEINKIIEDHEHLSMAYEEYKDQFDSIAEKHKVVSTAHDQSQELQIAINEYYADSKTLAEKISTLKNEVESKYEITSKYETEIKDRRESITDIAAKIAAMEKRSELIQNQADTHQKETEDLKSALAEQIEKNSSHQQEIQDTLGNANRMGMAGSFKLRKEELNKPIVIWAAVFVVAILAIFFIGYHFVSPYFIATAEQRKVFNYSEMIMKIALVSPFIWLAWMSVKQYGYLTRILEDYAYKYASAMAFEGYKKQAKEIDEDLLKQLLDVSVYNLSQNPIRLYSAKDNHASPANEIIKDLTGILQLQKKDTTSKGKQPAKTKEADNKPVQ